MRLSRADFPLMQWSLLSFAVSLIVSLLVIFGSSGYADSAAKTLREAQSQLNEARSRLAAAHDDQNNMAVYADEYGTLKANRIIGDEQRLDWIEGMEALRRQNLVTDFRYAIAPQKGYTAKQPIANGNFDIRYSEMKLQFELLHEEQLLDFFAALRRQLAGWYQLEGCKLQRASPEEGDTAQLLAECSGGWITLKNRNESQ